MSSEAGRTKADRIRAVPMFAGADRSAIDNLTGAADEVTVEQGRTLVTQGEFHHEAYVVESGAAEVLVDGEPVADIPPGEMVGELGFFDPGPATATVRAKTDMSVLVIPYNRFESIIDDHPAMLRAVAKELAARLRAADAKLC